MIGGNDVDLHVVLGGIEILDRHLGRRDRAGSAYVGIETRHVRQNADLDCALRLRAANA